MQPDTPQTKAELLARVRAAHTHLLRAFEQFDADALVAPGSDGWSAKDIMAHVTSWEQVLLRSHIGGAAYEDAVDIDVKVPTLNSTDEINAWLHQQYQAMPLLAVRARFDQSYQQVIDTLEAIDEDTLLHGYSAVEPDQQLLSEIGNNTWGHYDEHTAMLRQRGQR